MTLKIFCIIAIILITYWKMFGGKRNDYTNR